MIALLSTFCCVNSCNHLCSVGKLLSSLVNILAQDIDVESFMQLVALFVGVVITSSMQIQGQGDPATYDDVRYFQENNTPEAVPNEES